MKKLEVQFGIDFNINNPELRRGEKFLCNVNPGTSLYTAANALFSINNKTRRFGMFAYEVTGRKIMGWVLVFVALPANEKK